MKKLIYLPLLATFLLGTIACNESQKTELQESSAVEEREKPTRHIIVADISSRERAIVVMDSTNAELMSREMLDTKELSDIHFITYSLEKAIAYFAENSTGEQQKAAEELAILVEEVHLNSENNRSEETKVALEKYFKLAEAFAKTF